MYSTILKQRRLHDTLRRLNYTSLIWFVYNSFVLVVSGLKISTRTVQSVESGNMLSGRIEWGICYHICVNHAPGVTR
jgi:DsbC/DsbD-like thiol-disulfide interchange protein